MLAEQLTAETGVLVESEGRSLEMWKNNMNRDEHLFDCVVGCYVLANIRGATLQSDKMSKGLNNKRRRKRYVKG
jgi:phage terminase large subunit GpA-like protein